VRTALAALLIVVLGCGVAGCGSSGEERSAEAVWADGFCGSLTKWKTSVQSAAASVKNVDEFSKAKLEDATATVADANTQLVDDVKGLGAPPKTGGNEAQAAVEVLSGKLQASAAKVKDATGNSDGAQDTLTAVNVASAALLEMSADISATLTTLESIDAADTWKNAFADSKACQSLDKS
jgi:hypothetical protein